MADTPGFRRRVTFGLILALVVATLDVARLLTYDEPEPARRATAPAPIPAAETTTPVPSAVAPAPASGELPLPPASAVAPGAAANAGASVVAPDPPAQSTAPPTTPPVATVSCESDLELEESPDAPYNFLCLQDGVPVTWPDDSIRLYSSGLSPEQRSALEIALPVWEAQGRFRVTQVDSAAAANVTLTTAVLENAEDGHAVVHYTCLASCAFDRVTIQLSSTRELTKPLWITTVLHELGHAAGLNHVSRTSEVMYPELDLLSPTVYGEGDVAGLQELARVRGSAAP